MGKLGPGVQNKAGQRLIEFCQENALVIANTLLQEHKRKNSIRVHHQMVNTEIKSIIYSSQPKLEMLYTVSKNNTRSCLWLTHELLIAKFRLKLKKVGKATRPFKYDLNQISYNYTVGVTNRFKGLDLIDRVPEELWMEVHDIV